MHVYLITVFEYMYLLASHHWFQHSGPRRVSYDRPVAPAPSYSVATSHPSTADTQTKITFHCVATSSAVTDSLTL